MLQERQIFQTTWLTYSRDEAKITLAGVHDKPGVSAAIFNAMAEANISVDMIVQSDSPDGKSTDMTFTLAESELKKALDILESSREAIGFNSLLSDSDVVKISVVGVGMRTHVGIARKMFQALSERGINVQAISTSEIKISVLIASEYAELAVRAPRWISPSDHTSPTKAANSKSCRRFIRISTTKPAATNTRFSSRRSKTT